MNSTQSEKAATINDIARAVGVSKTTVSRALAGQGYYSAETRDAIRRTARRLKYEPNPHAQRLLNGRCDDMVGLFSLNLDLSVGTKKVGLLQKLLTDAGFEVPIYASIYGGKAADQARLMKALCSQRPRAVVCCTNALLPDTVQELLFYIGKGGLVVTYDFPIDLPCDKVVFDREDNTYQATRHLLQLGHRKVALIGNGIMTNGCHRYHGYLRALAEFDITPSPEWLIDNEEADDPYTGMYEEGGVRDATHFLQLKPRPSAACVLDDFEAVGFAAQLEREGVRVPEDISVVGHDDEPIAHYGPLQLTTVTHPVLPIVRGVFELLTERLEGSYVGPPRTLTVRGDLIVRESTLPLRPRARKTVLSDLQLASSEPATRRLRESERRGFHERKMVERRVG